MSIRIAFVVVILAVALCGSLCFAGTNVNGTITFGGKAHDYILHVPTSYASGHPTSLVISLHGYTFQPSTYMNVDNLWKTADSAGFLIVYPHGTNNSWNSGPYCCGNNTNDDVGLMLALIDTLAAHYSVDRDRIYAVGCSNGSMMANRLAAEKADVFAAVVGVAGPLALSATNSELKPSRPVSVMDFHALSDMGVPYNGGFGGGAPAETLSMSKWASVNGCDMVPTVTNYDNQTTVKTWKKPNSPVEVILYTTQDGQHGWPPAHVVTAGAGVDAWNCIDGYNDVFGATSVGQTLWTGGAPPQTVTIDLGAKYYNLEILGYLPRQDYADGKRNMSVNQPVTVMLLSVNGARVFGYSAMVGSGEREVVVPLGKQLPPHQMYIGVVRVGATSPYTVPVFPQ